MKEKLETTRIYHATGKSLIDGTWQRCGWDIRATSFEEAAKIAENDATYKLYSLSIDNPID